MNYLDCVQELYETVDLRWEPGACLKALTLGWSDWVEGGGKGLCQCDSCGWSVMVLWLWLVGWNQTAQQTDEQTPTC